MLKAFLSVICTLLLAAPAAVGQAAYRGTVGNAPIELALNATEEGELTGVYLYTKIGAPIGLGGTLRRGVLLLTEPDAHGKPAATLTIPAFAARATRLTGTWRSLATGRQLPLVLASRPASEGAADGPRYELLQTESLKNSYFQTVLAGEPDNYASRVVAVRVLAKGTNRLVQQVAVDCQSQGLHSVSVGDFNFDGYPDFSVFESSYAGPNTTSLYYLYNPATQRYTPSGFEGTSLEFDAKKRRVYEHNSCCAGSSVTSVEYKVVRNKLVELARHCYRWDDKKEELVERPFSACQ